MLCTSTAAAALSAPALASLTLRLRLFMMPFSRLAAALRLRTSATLTALGYLRLGRLLFVMALGGMDALASSAARLVLSTLRLVPTTLRGCAGIRLTTGLPRFAMVFPAAAAPSSPGVARVASISRIPSIARVSLGFL